MTLCLDDDSLERVLQGQLADAQQIGHVDTCVECQQKLESRIEHLNGDEIARRLEALRASRQSEGLSSEAVNRMLLALDTGLNHGEQPFPEIPGYEVVEFLGIGGMGAVYKGRHLRLQRYDAIKVLKTAAASSAHLAQRFDREMAAVGRLNHEHLVRGYDASEHDGVRYLVMEYLEGLDVGKVAAQNGPLAVADACEIARQAALGLQAAHEQNLVHRDIKPSNLMICQAGNNGATVKVLDMGLAAFSDAQAPVDGLTADGQIMGTLEYLAPEQATSSHTADHRADIYSLGCTLYKLLCGEAPFSTEVYRTSVEFLTALATKTPQPIAERRNIPVELAELIGRMISRDPERRPATAAEVATDLAPFCGGEDCRSLLDTTVQRRATVPGSTVAEHTQTIAPAENLAVQKLNAPVAKKSPWLVAAVALLVMAALCMPALFLFRTSQGAIRVKVSDPSLMVSFKQGEVIVKGKQTKRITFRPGEHFFTVKRGGQEYETRRFVIHDGDDTLLQVDWIDGRIQVAENGKVSQLALPARPSQPEPPLVLADDKAKPATWQRGSRKKRLSRGLVPAPAAFPGVTQWQLYVRGEQYIDDRFARYQTSPDGKYVARILGIGRSHTRLHFPQPQLRVHDAKTGELIYLAPVAETKYSPVWSKDSQSLAIDGEKFKRKLNGARGAAITGPVRGETWPNTTPELSQQLGLKPNPSFFNSVNAWDRSGKFLALCLKGGIHIFTADGVRQKILRDDALDGRKGISWSADGRYISCVGEDKLAIWDVATGTVLKEFSDARIAAAEFHPRDAERLAVAGETPTVVRWRQPQGFAAAAGVTSRNASSQVLKWSDNGDYVACNHWPGFTILDKNGKVVCRNQSVAAPRQAFFFMPGSERLMIGSASGLYSQLTLEGKQIEVEAGAARFSYYLDVSPRGKVFAMSDEIFLTENASPGKPVEQAWDGTKDYSGYAVPAFSSDGRHLATSRRLGTVLRNTADYQIECIIVPLPDEQYVTLSAAGEILAASEHAGDYLVYLVEQNNGALRLYRPSEFTAEILKAR